MKFRKLVNKNLLKAWYFSVKPLAIVLKKLDSRSYKRLKHKCENMSDEELIRRFTKYIIKDMIKSNKQSIDFIIFNKRGQYDDLQESGRCIIQKELRNISHSCRDKLLKSWYYHSKKADLWYGFNSEDKDEVAVYEKELNNLLKLELDKLGVKTEYIDVRDTDYRGKGDRYDSYAEYLKRIGYEKTLVIHL